MGREVTSALATQAPAETLPYSVALVHDYLTQRGGAERVVASMARAFEGAPLYTSLYDPAATLGDFAGVPVRTMAINRVAALRRHHRAALPVLAPSFSSLRVRADVVLCSSSGWAHGARVEGRKVVYCHAPARWLYQADRYLRGGSRATSAALAALRPWLSRWDRRAADTADRYLANSSVVRTAIAEVYGRDAEVIPPPYGIDPQGERRAVTGVGDGFHLCVSRLLPYKNVDVLVEAFRELRGSRLVVAGTGPLEERLRAAAPPNVLFLGRVDDAELRWLYAGCRALVAASYEDYGLTPLEAAVFGQPCAVLRAGGYLDTVIEGRTGLFFDAVTPAAVREAVRGVEAAGWDADAIRAHAADYSEEAFIGRLRDVVGEEWRRATTAAC